MSDDKIRIGGLWKNDGQSGVSYLSGGFGQAKLLVFQNNYKRGEKDPDYVMYLAPKQQREQSSGTPAPNASSDFGDDPIPF